MAKKTKRSARYNPADAARDLATFIDASPSPYHAVSESQRRLNEAGFSELSEAAEWRLQRGAKHYVIRQDSSILAFIVGQAAPSTAGFTVIGAHTDSPCLKPKPQPDRYKEGFAQIGCEVYGGAITATWTDRDLIIAGRVIASDDKVLTRHLVRLEKPKLRVPNLAIHLQRGVNEEGLKLNPQSQLVPVIALAKKGDVQLQALLAEALGKNSSGKKFKATDVVAFDLCLADAVPSSFGGLDDAFLFAPRLDNLASSHAALTALISTAEAKAASTRVIALFDHEEVGSTSAQGAGSPLLRDTFTRIVNVLEPADKQAYSRAMAQSFFISADMAHGVHPNYADLHEPNHMPMLGKGPVIKMNSNQRYATSGASAAQFAAWADKAGVTLQRFVTRSDLGCGSTIGPITAGELGITTVDVGNPMLSMHSIREMAASADVAAMIAVMQTALTR